MLNTNTNVDKMNEVYEENVGKKKKEMKPQQEVFT